MYNISTLLSAKVSPLDVNFKKYHLFNRIINKSIISLIYQAAMPYRNAFLTEYDISCKKKGMVEAKVPV